MSIPNHITSSLSTLDLEMIESVPPGGNWKNIPLSIPSKRLDQIREGFRQGKGSRSTYYGRMTPNNPSYTISTYFNRPGNGCFTHYDFEGDQHRLISQREGARLQSFPDDYVFYGSKTSIYKQIGNAVPPLLSYQIALTSKEKGVFIDLFSGAGGLSKGFEWAGWKCLLGNDIEKHYLKTFEENHNCRTLLGDISDDKVYSDLISIGKLEFAKFPKSPKIIIGGPPCQGFSTAGKKRSMEDARNHLFEKYASVLIDLKPDAFVFENVMGLVSMNKGKVFELIKNTLEESGYSIGVMKLSAEEYGVPQRRKRIIIHGYRGDSPFFSEPKKITQFNRLDKIEFSDNQLRRALSVKEALGDLPRLGSNEDGSSLNYTREPDNIYMNLMRGYISPSKYIKSIVKREYATNK
jgi:DNA (cytosine-5)-methyltransferase 1